MLFFRKSESLSAWGLFPELGYMYQRRDLGTTALFNAGLGLGYMPSPWLYLATFHALSSGASMVPTLTAPRLPSSIARPSACATAPSSACLQASCSWSSRISCSLQGRTQHELVVLVGLDLFRLTVVGALLAFRR